MTAQSRGDTAPGRHRPDRSRERPRLAGRARVALPRAWLLALGWDYRSCRSIKYQKRKAPWRQFALPSISCPDKADHAEFIAAPMMQESGSRTPCTWYWEHSLPRCLIL